MLNVNNRTFFSLEESAQIITEKLGEEITVEGLISKALEIAVYNNADILSILTGWNQNHDKYFQEVTNEAKAGDESSKRILKIMRKPVYYPANKANGQCSPPVTSSFSPREYFYLRLSDERCNHQIFSACLFDAGENLVQILTGIKREGIEELSIKELCMTSENIENYLESIMKCPNNIAMQEPKVRKRDTTSMDEWMDWRIKSEGLDIKEPMPIGLQTTIIKEVKVKHGYSDNSAVRDSWERLNIRSEKTVNTKNNK